MFRSYLTEIISKNEWRVKKDMRVPFGTETPYRKKVIKDINFKEYKENIKALKILFKKMNKGIFKSTLVFDYESIQTKPPKLTASDNKAIEIIKKLDYEVSEESYMLGFANKNGKPIMINEIFNNLNSKIDKLPSMLAAYEKTKNEAIKKQIDIIEEYDQEKISIEHAYFHKIAKEKGFKLVLSIQPRLIASQSTKVGWKSCMNLDDGEYNEFVGKGIAEGVIVAYLAKVGDEVSLKSPSARILIKPLKNTKGDIIYVVDKIYGSAPDLFKQKVISVLENNDVYAFQKEQAKLKEGVYTFNFNNLYDDDISSEIPGGKVRILSPDKLKKESEVLEILKKTKYDYMTNKELILALGDELKDKLLSNNKIKNITDFDLLLSFNKFDEDNVLAVQRNFGEDIYSGYDSEGQAIDEPIFNAFEDAFVDYIKNSNNINKEIVKLVIENAFGEYNKKLNDVVDILTEKDFVFPSELILIIFSKWGTDHKFMYNAFKPDGELLYKIIAKISHRSEPMKFFATKLKARDILPLIDYFIPLVENEQEGMNKEDYASLIRELFNANKFPITVFKKIANDVIKQKTKSKYYNFMKFLVNAPKKFIAKLNNKTLVSNIKKAIK